MDGPRSILTYHRRMLGSSTIEYEREKTDKKPRSMLYLWCDIYLDVFLSLAFKFCPRVGSSGILNNNCFFNYVISSAKNNSMKDKAYELHVNPKFAQCIILQSLRFLLD